MRQPCSPEYRQLWRLIDGAILDALNQHPNYVAPEVRRRVRQAIAKRAVGAVMGHAAEAARGRSVAQAAAADA
jgi:hypothetical protein